MYRIVGAFCLVAIIVGVVYLSQIRTKDHQTQSYSEGVKKGAAEAVVQKRKADSVLAVSTAQQKAYQDSLKTTKARAESTIDSLSTKVATQDSQIAEYAAELKKRPKTKAIAANTGNSTALTTRHQEILAYYKNRYQTLPKDLSEYEMRVALTEIRDDTANKFSISLAELETIRRKGGLTF